MAGRGTSRSVVLLGVAVLSILFPVVSRDGAALTHALTPSIAPSSARVPAGLREAASAAAGSDEPRFHLRRIGSRFVATNGKLTAHFDATGVAVAAGGATASFRLQSAPGVPPTVTGNRVEFRRHDLTEWYVNGPLGLEQGFTLMKPAAVALRLSGAATPRLHGGTLALGDSLRYGDLRAFDAGGRELPAHLVLDGRVLRLQVDDAGARYPVTIDPMIQQSAALVPSDADPSGFGQFGWSVALSTDGNTALIGAPSEAADVGAAWVFVRSNGAWTQQAKLTGTADELGAASFGYSVALSGDGNTALIGGYADNNEHGAVWSTTRSGATWSTPAKIPFPANTENGIARFGWSVALSTDGKAAAIGGPEDSGNAFASPQAFNGAAWVYINNGSGWTEDQKLLPGFGEESGPGSFGASVAIQTTCGQCASGRVLVGAPQDNRGASFNGAGKVWVYSGADGWLQEAQLLPSDANANSAFGESISLSGDGTTALIGGPTDDPLDDGSQIGSAWVFTSTSPSSWSQAAHLIPSDVSSFAFFGDSVALSPDGQSALVGGDNDAFSTGAAWLFKNQTTWTEICKELPSEEIASEFGLSVALGSDGTEFIGGPGSATANDEGAAWAFIEGACVSNVSSTVLSDGSARIQGTVDPKGHAVSSYRVDYGTTTAYGQSTTAGSLGANASPAAVDQTLTGLQPSTTYHYRVAATSAEGTAGQDQTFTTGPQLTGTAGTVVSGVLATDVGCPQTATIDWGDGTAPQQVALATGQPSHCFNPPARDEIDFVVNEGHTYAAAGHYTIKVTTDVPKTYGAGALITAAPTISNTASQDTSSTSSTVTATINPNGAATSYIVEYGTSTAYGQQTASAAIGSAFTGQAVGQVLSGLTPSTTYHFRFVATNPAGTTQGPDASFTTSAASATAAPPTIAGEAATVVGSDSATVQASINPNGSATTFVVQYGTTTAYGLQTASVAIGSGNVLQVVSQALTGLTPSTTYHFRFVATNAAGTTAGPDATFTTAVPGGSSAQPPPAPAQGVSANVFPLTGTVLVNGQPLAIGQQIPLGSIIDATKGTVLIRTVVNGVVQEMQFSGGIFQLLQLPNGITQLVLRGGDFSVCKTKTKTTKKKGVRSTSSTTTALSTKTVRMLWGNGKGSFQTKGKYAAATVRGTIYLVADRCDGTLTRVRQGTVSVLDLVRNKTVNVSAGKSYLVKP